MKPELSERRPRGTAFAVLLSLLLTTTLTLLASEANADEVTVVGSVLPIPLHAASAVWDGANAYVFGGLQGGSQDLSQIVRYDPQADDVATMEGALPSTRYGTIAVWDGTAAYIFGGEHMVNPSFATHVRDIVRYDPATDSIATMSATLPGTDVLMGGTGVWDGHDIYLFGAYSFDQGGAGEILRYTPATDTLVKMGAQLTIVDRANAVWDGSNVYVFGAYTGSETSYSIARYSPATDTVSMMQQSLPPVQGARAVWSGSQAYLFGGVRSGRLLSQVMRYDPAQDVLTTLSVTLPSPRSDMAAVWSGTSALLFGGCTSESGCPTNQIVRYTPGASDAAPTVTIPEDIVVEATAAGGAIVSFEVSATDSVDGELPVTCDPASGTVFPLGDTTVTCQATDSEGNVGSAYFRISIVDTTPPQVVCMEPAPSYTNNPAGAIASFSCAAQDVVDGNTAVACNPTGPGFPVGDTLVACTATDLHGNVGQSSFHVIIVLDMDLPFVALTNPMPGNLYVQDMGQPVPLSTPLIIGKKTVEAVASDNIGISQVVFLVDGVPYAVVTGDEVSSFIWDADAESAGNHIVSTCAFDFAGNSVCSSLTVKTLPTTVEGGVQTAL